MVCTVILCSFVFFELDLNTLPNLVVLDLGTIPRNVDIVNIVEEDRKRHDDIEYHQDRIYVNTRLVKENMVSIAMAMELKLWWFKVREIYGDGELE